MLSKIFHILDHHVFDVYTTDDEGWTTLYYSVREGSYESIKNLLAMGTNIKLATKNGKNCLHIAADYGHFNLCTTFISKYSFDVQLPDHSGCTAFHYFAKKGNYELVKFVVDIGIDIINTTDTQKNCLHIAAEYGHLNLYRALTSKHDVDHQLLDHYGWTALHYFAKIGSYELVKAVADMGIDINLKTNNGKNCLHIAADYDHLSLCKSLISKHIIDAQLPDHDGWTALHYFPKKDSYELVKAAADTGIYINLATNNGEDCLHIAADYGHSNLYRMLLSKQNVDF